MHVYVGMSWHAYKDINALLQMNTASKSGYYARRQPRVGSLRIGTDLGKYLSLRPRAASQQQYTSFEHFGAF